MTLTAQIIEKAAASKKMIATAESCTGGLVAAALTDVPGSSAVVERGFVTYANCAKIEMLGVTPETLGEFGAVSEQTAIEMARGARSESHADISVSVTGIAGPGGSEHKPEGRVCFAVAKDGGIRAETVDFGPLGRKNVRLAARDHALRLLLSAL
ncbi:CinA family protein [uncultured Roseobacter sp.]|uniref:CinA family protein n=1 Tax=uncultured Roseobacter sp. TaxID=114847 RepID=UPI0026306FBB|nr:CinA family protein [uncultured Roseobacter sp.]